MINHFALFMLQNNRIVVVNKTRAYVGASFDLLFSHPEKHDSAGKLRVPGEPLITLYLTAVIPHIDK
jgi:hypothetical protein